MTFGDGQSFVFSSSGASAPQIWQKLVLSEHRDADGYAIAYGYAATATTRRLNAITGPNGRALAVTSTAHGPTRIDLPDATHLIYSYDDATSNRKRLTRVERRRADNSVVSAEGYRYALRGLGTLLAGVDDADGDARANYDYDKVGRVASTEKGGGAESFDYAYLPGADSYHSVTRRHQPARARDRHDLSALRQSICAARHQAGGGERAGQRQRAGRRADDGICLGRSYRNGRQERPAPRV